MTTQTKPFFYKNKLTVAISTAIMGLSINAYAADEEAKPDDNAFEQIVVTGSVGGRTQIESAIAVTSIDDEVIQNFKPNSEVELFRLIPGIQANGGNGPGGNANIAVRGLPVATGGSPFVQIQEDGLPTVLFGDMQFGNNDYWTRFDASTARVESVRGGTATTFASQAPGAIINYISHTGEVEGGYVGLSTGIGYDEKRVDFRYGGSASDSVLYHDDRLIQEEDTRTDSTRAALAQTQADAARRLKELQERHGGLPRPPPTRGSRGGARIDEN